MDKKKLKDDGRSRMNFRLVYSLMAGTAATAADMLYILMVDPVDAAIMQPQGLFSWSLYMLTEQKWSMAKRVHCDQHVRCCQ